MMTLFRCVLGVPTLLLAVVSVLSLNLSLLVHSADGAGAAGRPNIVMVFTDDQGWHDVGCYGSEIPTPHIDSLARDGMKLNQFYAASSICTPSRYGLFTGRYPTRSHDQLLSALMFLTDKNRGLRKHETTYVAQLRGVGYRTALVGKWHLGHGDRSFLPIFHGFESFFGHTGGCVDFFSLHYGTRPDWYRNEELVFPKGYATDVITDEANRLLGDFATQKQPFYLHIAYNAPHFGKAGNMETGEISNKMQPKPADLLRVAPEITEPARRAMAAKVIGMDEGIGKILKRLDELKLSENTFVIFMTDHGGDPVYGGNNAPLRGSKAELYEGGLRVPCLVRWPGKVAAGSQSDAVLCAIDCYRTFCELARVKPSGKLDGTSMLPVLLGKSKPKRRELFWCTGSHAELARSEWTALRQGDWKLVNPPDSKPMLFDLDDDPYELTDLADQQGQRVDSMLQRIGHLKMVR